MAWLVVAVSAVPAFIDQVSQSWIVRQTCPGADPEPDMTRWKI
jgi:hypothetical protein